MVGINISSQDYNAGCLRMVDFPLFYKNLNVLAILVINYIYYLSGRSEAQGFHQLIHIHTVDFGCKMGANLHAGFHQADGDLDGGF
jgi:hypothetical protein